MIQAVNVIMDAVSSDHIQALDSTDSEALSAQTMIERHKTTILASGWPNNTERLTLSADASGEVTIPSANYLQVLLPSPYQRRNGKVYDPINNTLNIGKSVTLWVAMNLPFEELDEQMRIWIARSAAVEFASRAGSPGDRIAFLQTERDAAALDALNATYPAFYAEREKSRVLEAGHKFNTDQIVIVADSNGYYVLPESSYIGFRLPDPYVIRRDSSDQLLKVFNPMTDSFTMMATRAPFDTDTSIVVIAMRDIRLHELETPVRVYIERRAAAVYAQDVLRNEAAVQMTTVRLQEAEKEFVAWAGHLYTGIITSDPGESAAVDEVLEAIGYFAKTTDDSSASTDEVRKRILQEVRRISRDILAQGHPFNTKNIKLDPDNDGRVAVPVPGPGEYGYATLFLPNFIIENGAYFYDRKNRTDIISRTLYINAAEWKKIADWPTLFKDLLVAEVAVKVYKEGTVDLQILERDRSRQTQRALSLQPPSSLRNTTYSVMQRLRYPGGYIPIGPEFEG